MNQVKGIKEPNGLKDLTPNDQFWFFTEQTAASKIYTFYRLHCHLCSYVDKYNSKVQSTGSRVAPCFPACDSFKQEAVEKLKSSSAESLVLGPLTSSFGNMLELQTL